MIKSKFLNDFSNVAQGAFSTVNAIREELDIIIKSKLERLLTSKGLITREDYDVLDIRISQINNKIDGLEAIITKHSEELKKIKNKILKGK